MKNCTAMDPEELEDERVEQLDLLIERTFAHLFPDEVDALAAEYATSTTRMLEVIDVEPRNIVVQDIYDDLDFLRVTFPDDIAALLRRQDVFLVTMGLRNKRWHVISMGPRYESFEFTEEDLDEWDD